MKKHIIIFAIAVITVMQASAQNGAAINSSGAAADPSAMLDVSSNNRGVLIPRMSEVERTSIINPARGLMVYQIDNSEGFWYFDGAAWGQFGDNLGNHIATDSVNMSNKKITNLATCTHNLDAANKEYVDNSVSAGGGGVSLPTMISDESATNMTFIEAIRYCRNLTEAGFTDWIMPTTKDVFYILQLGGITVIPNEFSSNRFWLSDDNATLSSYPYNYYNIRLSDLYRTGSQYNSTMYARCVR